MQGVEAKLARAAAKSRFEGMGEMRGRGEAARERDLGYSHP